LGINFSSIDSSTLLNNLSAAIMPAAVARAMRTGGDARKANVALIAAIAEIIPFTANIPANTPTVPTTHLKLFLILSRIFVNFSESKFSNRLNAIFPATPSPSSDSAFNIFDPPSLIGDVNLPKPLPTFLTVSIPLSARERLLFCFWSFNSLFCPFSIAIRFAKSVDKIFPILSSVEFTDANSFDTSLFHESSDSYTDTITTQVASTDPITRTIGGPSNPWGKSWSADDINAIKVRLNNPVEPNGGISIALIASYVYVRTTYIIPGPHVPTVLFATGRVSLQQGNITI